MPEIKPIQHGLFLHHPPLCSILTGGCCDRWRQWEREVSVQDSVVRVELGTDNTWSDQWQNYVLFIAVMCAHPHLSSPPGPWWWRWCWSPRSRCRRWWAPGYHECQCRHPSILTIKILELGEASFLWSVQLHTLLREFVWCLHTWMPPAE